MLGGCVNLNEEIFFEHQTAKGLLANENNTTIPFLFISDISIPVATREGHQKVTKRPKQGTIRPRGGSEMQIFLNKYKEGHSNRMVHVPLFFTGSYRNREASTYSANL